jgi:hypothetical protein
MPSHKKNTTEHQRESEFKSELCCPRTRAKNATQYPGVEAKKTLWVCRAPAVIQEEKEAQKRKKEEKECTQQEKVANNKAAAHFIKKNSAQQEVSRAEEEASMPHCRSQGM